MKELGRIATAIAETGLHSHGLALFTQVGGLSPEEAKKICDDTQADINGRKVHAYNRRK